MPNQEGAQNSAKSNIAFSLPYNFQMEQHQVSSDLMVPLEKEKKAVEYPTFKKSVGTLKKYLGTGSRNCFFTPIQCMIQHDMSKYKKLVDSNIQIGRISRRDPNFLSP